MSRNEGKRGKGNATPPDREALREAFAGVKPLRDKSPRRVQRPADAVPARPSRPPGEEEPLLVERESNGIVWGRRAGVHRSILDALEDPKLEVEAQCDLHGLTAREAEREVHRFVRGCQQAGKRWVLIIVGKGLHSPRGKGALQWHVVQALSQRASARFVDAFHTAPRRLGGTGALVVRLR
jgi:DNA-nicking Smr family endonuclease